jgi:hypothetical protein
VLTEARIRTISGPAPAVAGLLRVRRGAQRLDLSAELRLDGDEQPVLDDALGVGQVPVVKPGHHDREVLQAGNGADAVGVQQLVAGRLLRGADGKRLVLRGRLQVLGAGMSDGAGKVDAINGKGHHECCDFRRGPCQRRTPVHSG